uniref:beta-glucosidase n=1 Tax=Coccidioides immitis TaxID=5501 RepID=O14424_COCIT|nr:beta-glucosidase [Coccidioides posadasii]
MSPTIWIATLLYWFAFQARKSVAAPPGVGALDDRAELPDGFHSPQYYPAPRGLGAGMEEAYSKAHTVVSKMTLAGKVNLTTGTGFLMALVGQTGSALRFGIPRLCLQDGPLGLRNTDHNTAFPAGISVGATFDKKLMYERGCAMGEEFRGKGANVHLGPSVGPLGRKPRGGRNWEGFGSDPSLQAIAAVETIKGVQSKGVIATIKHLVGNEQEMYRMTNIVQRAYSANIDDRTMHELYLWPFAESVRAGVGAVMMAYNDVNGSASCQNSKLINGILKDELGFQGFVMTDWYAQIGGVSSALAGLDMSMPGDGSVPLSGTSFWASELSRSILNGTVALDRLNDMVTRIVATWFKFGQDKDFPLPNFSSYTQNAKGLLYPGALFSPLGVVNQFVNVQADHHKLARVIARESITLLKNEDNLLPLDPNRAIKYSEQMPGTNPRGINACPDKGCNKGVLTMGWGSGTSNLPYLVTPEDAIRNISKNTEFHITDKFPNNVQPGPDDVAIVFVNADSGENYIIVESNPGDRTVAQMKLWHNGDELIESAAKKFSNVVVVVVHTVGPIIMEKWIDLLRSRVSCLPDFQDKKLEILLLISCSETSVRVAASIYDTESRIGLSDSVSLINQRFGQIQDTFTEGLFIDYRHFQKENITPRYHFGYGLSYTTFNFTEPRLESVTTLSEYPPARKPKAGDRHTPTISHLLQKWPGPKTLTGSGAYLYPYLDNPSAIKPKPGYPYPEAIQPNLNLNPRAGGSEAVTRRYGMLRSRFPLKLLILERNPVRAVAQLYVELPTDDEHPTPKLQLRQFEKTATLEPGQSEVLKMEITRKDVSIWDTMVQDWKVPATGKGIKLWIGASVGDLKAVCETGKGKSCHVLN